MIDQLTSVLNEQFNNNVRLSEKRPGIYQLMAPLYHEDGDPVEVFLENIDENGTVRISDHGITVMRLSYDYDLDTTRKEEIFSRIVAENKVNENDGRLFIDTNINSLYPSLMQFTQCVAKVSNMRHFKREVIKSLFYEMLEEFVYDRLVKYDPKRKTLPLPDRDDLEVDFEFSRPQKPVYLFGIKDDSKARIATIACLEFGKAKLPFTSIAIHEDFEALSKKDRKRITSAVDKQFVDIDDFRSNGERYLEREAA